VEDEAFSERKSHPWLLQRMKRVGSVIEEFLSYNTCDHHGRVLHFSQEQQKLRVTEVLLGESTQCVSITTETNCKTDDDWLIACCSLGEHMLVMAGWLSDVFAALVEVGEGLLDESTVHLTELTIEGDKKLVDWPYLCPISNTRVLLYFAGRYSMWYCDINTTTITMKKLLSEMPTDWGFNTLPLCLPNGALLLAGADLPSTDITLLYSDDDPTFRKIGELPGPARCLTSTILIGDRFVVGFGGRADVCLDDLWIFDLQTLKGSALRREGQWHQRDQLVSLVVQNNTLYLLGGENSKSVHSISFQALSRLISSYPIIFSLSQWLGVAIHPVMRDWREEMSNAISSSL